MSELDAFGATKRHLAHQREVDELERERDEALASADTYGKLMLEAQVERNKALQQERVSRELVARTQTERDEALAEVRQWQAAARSADRAMRSIEAERDEAVAQRDGLEKALEQIEDESIWYGKNEAGFRVYLGHVAMKHVRGVARDALVAMDRVRKP